MRGVAESRRVIVKKLIGARPPMNLDEYVFNYQVMLREIEVALSAWVVFKALNGPWSDSGNDSELDRDMKENGCFAAYEMIRLTVVLHAVACVCRLLDKDPRANSLHAAKKHLSKTRFSKTEIGEETTEIDGAISSITRFLSDTSLRDWIKFRNQSLSHNSDPSYGLKYGDVERKIADVRDLVRELNPLFGFAEYAHEQSPYLPYQTSSNKLREVLEIGLRAMGQNR